MEDIIASVANGRGPSVSTALVVSGGRSVFLARKEDAIDLDETIEAVNRDGYALAQEELSAAAAGSFEPIARLPARGSNTRT